MSKRTTEVFESFLGGIKPQTLTRSGVQPIFNFKDLVFRDDIEVCAFRQEPADQSIGIFDGGFFPAMTGETEERFHAEAFIDFSMESIFEAIVVSDGLAEGFGDGRENAHKSLMGRQSRFVFDFNDAGVAGFTLNGDFESRLAFSDDEIRFPMAGFIT